MLLHQNHTLIALSLPLPLSLPPSLSLILSLSLSLPPSLSLSPSPLPLHTKYYRRQYNIVTRSGLQQNLVAELYQQL